MNGWRPALGIPLCVAAFAGLAGCGGGSKSSAGITRLAGSGYNSVGGDLTALVTERPDGWFLLSITERGEIVCTGLYDGKAARTRYGPFNITCSNGARGTAFIGRDPDGSQTVSYTLFNGGGGYVTLS
jgi:hypothetical protein